MQSTIPVKSPAAPVCGFLFSLNVAPPSSGVSPTPAFFARFSQKRLPTGLQKSAPVPATPRVWSSSGMPVVSGQSSRPVVLPAGGFTSALPRTGFASEALIGTNRSGSGSSAKPVFALTSVMV